MTFTWSNEPFKCYKYENGKIYRTGFLSIDGNWYRDNTTLQDWLDRPLNSEVSIDFHKAYKKALFKEQLRELLK